MIASYNLERAQVVDVEDLSTLQQKYQVIYADLIDEDSDIVRHDSAKLACALLPYLNGLKDNTLS
ncbi:hypothetical protein, partial [Staphylococcus pasteuri_A]